MIRLYPKGQAENLLNGASMVVVPFPKQPPPNTIGCGKELHSDNFICYDSENVQTFIAKPPCKVGDMLFLCESWMKETEQGIHTGGYIYKSTDIPEPDGGNILKWRSPATMPNSACRLKGRCMSVEAVQVKDINYSDAEKMGFTSDGYFAGKITDYEYREISSPVDGLYNWFTTTFDPPLDSWVWAIGINNKEE